MKIKDIIKKLLEEKDVSQASLASRTGLTPAALWDRLNNKKAKSMTIANAQLLLTQLDYKIVVIPRDAKTPTGGFVVDETEDDD